MSTTTVTESNAVTVEQVRAMMAEIDALKAANAKLAKGGRKTQKGMKVSEKGGVSIYGLGRFPATLYKEQWLKVLDMADDIRAFIKENDALLKSKAA
jgi:hypothetical protein